MKRLKEFLILTAIIFVSPLSLAGTNIDVLLVFSDDSNMSLGAKTILALEVEAKLGLVYGSSTLGLSGQLDDNQTITVFPLLVELSYDAAGKSGIDALDWMEDENESLSSQLHLARELFGTPGADLVVMVIPSTTSIGCGFAPVGPPLSVSNSHKESYAFAAVVPEDINSNCDDDIDFPHEIGHLLYAEHEDDDNDNVAAPDSRNHAIQSSASNLKSLMWDGLQSNGSNTEWLSGYLGTMTSPAANNVAFISDVSYDVVSTYRAPPFVPECQINFTPVCNAPYTNLISISLPGFPASNIDIDFSVGSSGSGTWNDIYEGSQTCPGFTSSLTNLIRAFYTSSQGISECQAVVVPIISPPGCDAPGSGIFD